MNGEYCILQIGAYSWGQFRKMRMGYRLTDSFDMTKVAVLFCLAGKAPDQLRRMEAGPIPVGLAWAKAPATADQRGVAMQSHTRTALAVDARLCGLAKGSCNRNSGGTSMALLAALRPKLIKVVPRVRSLRNNCHGAA